jgi:hypothetical protein
MAPPVLTCPNCLARVENPLGAQPGAATSVAVGPLPSVAPLPLHYRPYRLDQQVERDARRAGYALIGMVVVLAAGAIISFTFSGGTGVGVALAVAAAIVLAAAVERMRHPHGQGPAAEVAQAMGTFASGCFKVALIIVGIVLLLFGGCALLILTSSLHF